VQTSLGLIDGVPYTVPAMTTMDLTLSYNFTLSGQKARVRFAVKNLEDERAPTQIDTTVTMQMLIKIMEETIILI